MIHLHFWPVTGKWGIRDLHKTYVDDESYNSGHGNAYEFYGINPKEGALIIARPDQCKISFAAENNNYANLPRCCCCARYRGLYFY
jgi:hypothetical protein